MFTAASFAQYASLLIAAGVLLGVLATAQLFLTALRHWIEARRRRQQEAAAAAPVFAKDNCGPPLTLI